MKKIKEEVKLKAILLRGLDYTWPEIAGALKTGCPMALRVVVLGYMDTSGVKTETQARTRLATVKEIKRESRL